MPNWVMNNVSFFGSEDKINELRNFVMTSENDFDFNKIIPMPKSLQIEDGSRMNTCIEFAKLRKERGQNWKRTAKFKELSKGFNQTVYIYGKVTVETKLPFEKWADKGDQYLFNKENYGYYTWYEWCIDNWGTKWNACEASWRGRDCVSFETAWSTCEPIYRRLPELFPDVSFDVSFADEDLGNNCGTIAYHNGDFNVDYDMEDFEFACSVWGFDPEEMREDHELAE